MDEIKENLWDAVNGELKRSFSDYFEKGYEIFSSNFEFTLQTFD